MKTPTFEEWVKKYFGKPETKIMYKSNMKGDSKWYSIEDLTRRYKRAFKN